MNPYDKLDEMVRRDLGRRGVGKIRWANPMQEVASALAGARSVLVVTGFIHSGSGKPETDGPLGAAVLGRALGNLRIETVYATDAATAPVLKALRLDPVEVLALNPLPKSERRAFARETLRRIGSTHLVAIERPGRTPDGTFRNLRGTDISAMTEPLDELFLAGRDAGLWTLGIGDGGNEVGMGCLPATARDTLAGSLDHASVVATTRLVVAGVSNWGAYGVAAALSLLKKRPLLPDRDEMESDMRAALRAGAVDGITGKAEASVDGLAYDFSTGFMEELADLVASVR